MNEALLLCLHLLAATFWVGGMAAMHFAVRPAAVATLEAPQRLAFMAAALARFFAAVTAAIVVLLASGLALIAVGGGFGAMHWSVHAMFAVGLAMIAIFGWIRLVPFVRLQRALAAREPPRAAAALNTIRLLVATNLALGTLVFVLAVVGRAL
ncbi:MAG: CopD family protein [Piscinibacter sp.]|nr:CopD family protein [Piscinibacter sp.]